MRLTGASQSEAGDVDRAFDEAEVIDAGRREEPRRQLVASLRPRPPRASRLTPDGTEVANGTRHRLQTISLRTSQ